MADPQHDTFMRLFLESRAALRRYVRRLVRSRDTAEEVVQEAFLRTYEQRDSVHTPRAFLFSTARNLASDIRRHDRIAATESVGEFQDCDIVHTDTPLDTLLIADEASRLLKEAVDRLPAQCRAVFTLKVFHGSSYREIAQRLGLTEKTVEKHVARALLRTHGYMRARYTHPRSGEQRPTAVPTQGGNNGHG